MGDQGLRLCLLLRSEPEAGRHLWSTTPAPFSFDQTEQVERNYIKEKKAAVKEFEDKKVELKENLIAELEEKKKMIENEKLTMELTGGKEPWAWGCLSPSPASRLRGRSAVGEQGS